MKRTTLSSFLAVSCLAIILGGCSNPEQNTTYSNPYVTARFNGVHEESSLDEVYAVLGAPLFLHVNPDRFGSGAYRQIRDGDTTIGHVRSLMNNTNVELYLYYSEMKNVGGNYLLFRVDVRCGKVFNVVKGAQLD